MWWEVSIYKSIKIPQAKKAADSCKKDCLVCQYKCYCTTESQLLHLTGWMWTSVSWQRQLYSMHGVFPSPGNSAELVLVWRSLLWLERLVWVFEVCLYVALGLGKICPVYLRCDCSQLRWSVMFSAPQLWAQKGWLWWNSRILAQLKSAVVCWAPRRGGVADAVDLV